VGRHDRLRSRAGVPDRAGVPADSVLNTARRLPRTAVLERLLPKHLYFSNRLIPRLSTRISTLR
jgi:hypothetical protein